MSDPTGHVPDADGETETDGLPEEAVAVAAGGEPETGTTESDPNSEQMPRPPRLTALRDAWRSGQQGEFPFAVVQGEPVTTLPVDLYIPPDALEIILEAFEGPLDLLLYLIRRQNLDILELRVAEITEQYMHYVELMRALRFELAAEYLVMAAMLAEIKSRMLLPRPRLEGEEEVEDPRAELVRRLQEYERFKAAADSLDELPRVGRDVWLASVPAPEVESTAPPPEVPMKALVLAFADVMRRAELHEHHAVRFEPLSVRERMSGILDRLRESGSNFLSFGSFFTVAEGRRGVVVAFLALMELVRSSMIEVVQGEAFGELHIRARGS